MLDYIGGQRRIGHVAEMTGLSTSVLRAWDRRYGLGPTTRTPGGQRLYSDADIERIRTVQEMVRDGWPVDSAAHQVLDAGRPAPAGDPGRPDDATGADEPEEVPRSAFVAGLLEDMADPDLYATFVAYKAAQELLRARGAADVYRIAAWLTRHLQPLPPPSDCEALQ